MPDQVRRLVSEPSRSNGDAAPAWRPNPDDVAVEAYIIYCETGFHDGHDLDHWLEAERRLTSQRDEGNRTQGGLAH